MTELKTLKDLAGIIEHDIEYDCDVDKLGWVNATAHCTELRAEAIKEYKLMWELIKVQEESPDLGQKLPFARCDDSKIIKEWRAHLGSIAVYIKWKFNLTEEDLK